MGVLNVKRWDSCDKIQIQEYEIFCKSKDIRIIIKTFKI